MVTLGWADSYSFVPVAFNMMASADPKITSWVQLSELADASVAISATRKRSAISLMRRMATIRNALKAGIHASYILIDTWFTNEPFINNIHGEDLDVIGMLKDNK